VRQFGYLLELYRDARSPECKKMRSVCIVELPVIVDNTKILCVAQKRFYGEFMWLKTTQRASAFMQKCPVSLLVTKFAASGRIFMESQQNQISRKSVQWEPC
jgi:hypothetical protein